MAEETKLVAEIDAQVSGQQDAKALADALATVGEALNNLVTDARAAANVFSKVEQNVSGVSKQAQSAQKSVDNLNKSLATTNTLAANKSTAGDFAATRNLTKYGLNPDFQQTREALGINPDTAILKKQLATETEVFDKAKSAQQAKQKEFADYVSASNARIASSEVQSLQQTLGAQKAHQAELDNARAAYARAEKGMLSYRDGLANTRYALYGLTTSFAIAGTAILAANVGIVAAAASFQTSFANISRTAQVSGQDLTNLEQQFVELGQTIPASYSSLSDIATLAGQLNIPADNIASFTKSVAEFAATTNVSTDAAATAFGRLDQLLPDVRGNYEALGSSILNVGVNSVATESEIISTTSQIAAAGQQAGLTADEIIGLAASYASLGVAPEAARGTTIRVFSTIRSAVLEGGAALETFAKLSGESSQQFQQDWSTNTGETFLKVLTGLNKEGANAETTLRGLGITAVRDINALLKLSQNVELVGNNFGYAATGFTQATQLGDSFAKIADTLASKVQELLNSFQALFAMLGQSGLGAITNLVDMLKGFVVGLTQIAQNPFIQDLAGWIGGLTALSGVLLLVSSGVGRLAAAFLAGRPVVNTFNLAMDAYRAKLRVVVAENVAAGVSMNNLATRAKATGLAIGSALKGVGIGAAITVGLAASSAAIEYFTHQMQSASDAAKEYFGDSNALAEALQKDTDAAAQGAPYFREIQGSITNSTTTTADWVGSLESAAGAQVKTNDATQQTTDTITKQTYALGANAQAWLAQAVANDKNIQELFKNRSKYQQEGLDVNGFVSALAKGDIDTANKLYDEYDKALGVRAQKLQAGNQGRVVIDTTGLDKAKDLIKVFTGEIENATNTAQVFKAVSDATGISLEQLAGGADDATNSLDSTQSTLSQVQDAFASSNAIGEFANQFYTLINAIDAGSTSFDVFSQSGYQNLQNLQATIASAIDAASSMGISATEAVAIVFQKLQQEGVNTAQLLASLANIGVPGVSLSGVGQYMAGTKAMTQQGQQLSNVLNHVATGARSAAGGIKKTGGSAAEAAKQVYTLVDYANDLSGVFKRATDIRFGGQGAMDKIATGWQDIADKTAEANKKIKEAQATLAQLASDKAIDEYFLKIAQMYGDTLRAGDIQADLAKNAQDTASAQQDVASAQQDASKQLTGTSKAAIQNRAALTDLLGSYQDYITQLAASGADTATLQAKTAQLKQEFIAQALQMGYSADQVMVYAASFDDLTTAIQRVPRNITVAANTNPALQALNEFLAKARNSKATVPVSATGDGYGAGLAAGQQYGLGWVQGTSQYRRLVTRANGSVPGGKEYQYYGPGGAISPPFFGKGGYTGGNSPKDIAGVVHGQEYVIDAKNTSRLGIPFLDAMNSGKTPAVVAPTANLTVVQLSAQDRALLAAIPAGLRLSIGTKVVGAAADAANIVAANRGAN